MSRVLTSGGGGDDSDTDHEVDLDEPDTSEFVDGTDIDFRGILVFAVTFMILYVAELWTQLVETVFGLWYSASNWFYTQLVTVLTSPLEVWEAGLLASFEAAASDIGSLELLGFVAAAAFVAAWFFAAERVWAAIRRWI